MTSIACQSAALIAEIFAAIVETLLAIAENIRSAMQEPGAWCRKVARRVLALSRPMMPKPGVLPLSASPRPVFARKPSPVFERAIMVDLTAGSEARITALATPPAGEPRPSAGSLSKAWQVLPQSPDEEPGAAEGELTDLDGG